MHNPDVAIVGGGIGGSAMAIVLARAGLNVLMLEKSLQHKDVTRGEWLSPWGVLEADQLGLTPVYEADGAHRIDRHISYSDLTSAEEAELNTFDIAAMAPAKPLCIGHPRCCNLLNAEAEQLGVRYLRGITQLQVTPGTPPTLDFTHDQQAHVLQPRLIIGADGRNGIVAKQIGCTLSHDPEHHLFSGMLVENARDWPEDLQVIACEGDVNVLAFPQGHGRVRIYLGWPSNDRGRLVGPGGQKNFLDSWRIDCVPNAEAIASAIPASPCIAYPNHDAWLDSPVREGVVLIGDAAGRNDPIIGQGLSITHRDVRLVSTALLENQHWSADIFEEYVTERVERMARLRTTARLTSLRDSAFGEDGRRLRQQIHERIAAKPEYALPFAAAFIGPENVPGEAYEPAFVEQIVGAPIWNALP
jgi:2-polyprenyl-6-methoxyphenol hydroxylase-like FAD-dependent oxidoreductase